MELAKAQRELAITESKLENRRYELFRAGKENETSTYALEKQIKSLRQQCIQLKKRFDALKVKSPFDGSIVGIEQMAEKEEFTMSDARAVKKDTGNLLVGKDKTWIDSGTEICRVRPNDSAWATLTVKQSDQDLVAKRQLVYLLFNSNRSKKYSSSINALSYETESQQDLVDFETEGTTVKAMQQSRQSQQQGKPINQDGAAMDAAVILGRCRMEDSPLPLFGSTGVAKIYVGNRSAAWRAVRTIRLFINTKL